jgi:hypothetical protein
MLTTRRDGGEMTVVRRSAARRWSVVLAGTALLAALPTVVPAVVSAVASPPPASAADKLRALVRASAGQPHHGYVESSGRLGLPDLPRIGQIAALLSGTTRMRTWYAKKDRWRVDVIDTGAERGFYQTPDGTYSWDYGANQLTHIGGMHTLPVDRPGLDRGDGEIQITFVSVGPSARLPRPADLIPPDLARRLLSAAEGDRVTSIPGKRVAGIAAAGLRITPSDPQTTVGHLDIWADPRTGLPLQVEVTARGGQRPIFVTRFLDIEVGDPPADALSPPPRRDGVQFTGAHESDGLSALVGRGLEVLPDRLAGQQRHDPLVEQWNKLPWQDGRAMVLQDNPLGLYGTGLGRFVVLPLGRRVGREAYRGVEPWGQSLTFTGGPGPGGTGVLLSTSLLSLLVVESAERDERVYLIAGMVDPARLRQAAAELVGGATQ